PDGPPDSTLARPAEPIGPHCRPSAPSPAGGECRDAKGGALGDARSVCAPGAGAALSGARASPRDGSGAASVGTGADGAANRLLRHARTLRQPEPSGCLRGARSPAEAQRNGAPGRVVARVDVARYRRTDDRMDEGRALRESLGLGPSARV